MNFIIELYERVHFLYFVFLRAFKQPIYSRQGVDMAYYVDSVRGDRRDRGRSVVCSSD